MSADLPSALRKPACLFPGHDGSRCCECECCHWQPEAVRTIAITGSRDWADRGFIRAALTPYIERLPVTAEEPTVMHGAARGADTLAASEALDLGFWVESYPADWETHGRRAGILRNLQILDRKPDVVLAFRVNGSRGTTHMIEAARARKIPVVVFDA